MLHFSEVVQIFDDVRRVERYSLSIESAWRAPVTSWATAATAPCRPMWFVTSLVLAVVPLGATLVHREYRYQYHADGGDTRYGDDECREYLQVNDISVSRETLECGMRKSVIYRLDVKQ